jgi:hypothetical protein
LQNANIGIVEKTLLKKRGQNTTAHFAAMPPFFISPDRVTPAYLGDIFSKLIAVGRVFFFGEVFGNFGVHGTRS